MIIIPALLATTFDEFLHQFNKVKSFAPHIHLDIMDGEFVPAKTFADIERLKELGTDLKFELHLMVNDPIAEMRKWQAFENVFRVLFHIEAPSDPLRVLSFIKKEGWERGMALNPETPLSAVQPYLDKIDVLQFMAVHPGRQGQEFMPEVLEKIKQFKQITNQLITNNPSCAVDGGINKSNIGELARFRVEVANVGSAVTGTEDAEQAYEELKVSLRGA